MRARSVDPVFVRGGRVLDEQIEDAATGSTLQFLSREVTKSDCNAGLFGHFKIRVELP
jgi:hypothetical protein